MTYMKDTTIIKLPIEGYEDVRKFYNEKTGLNAIIAIHNTNLGPALGGCRVWNYDNETEATIDALRLSKGMSYKSAVSGLNLGGGKAVIICDPKNKTDDLLYNFGECLNVLEGKYITGEDVGVNVEDMEKVAEVSEYVVGLKSRKGCSGDPSPLTAYGVYEGMKAAVKRVLKKNSLEDLTISVQGLGNVGLSLVFGFPEDEKFNLYRWHFKGLIHEAKKLILVDINEEKIKKAKEKLEKLNLMNKVEFVGDNELFDKQVDIFSPCALGGVINKDSIPKLYWNNCKIIGGSANNQLKEEEDGYFIYNLNLLGIRRDPMLYVPDYVINAGGVINVCIEYENRKKGSDYNINDAIMKVSGIRNTVNRIIQESAEKGIPPFKAADLIAEKRMYNTNGNGN